MAAAANQPQPSFFTFLKKESIKSLLLALALFAAIGTAATNDSQPGKKAKKVTAATKMQCSKDEKAGASCCAKKLATATIATPANPQVAKK
ncbi:hypothetical protein [Hymenobacter defluvii]|uniref:Uncharacterized protein n=1 Tax=Hymenobacter defluvii TaxID=2054411 RepID=A0ABS3TEJ0_9BACT|nr:hypothetical protein [Hymenobacter defluvii]MBO3272076.1 hypothetical protein [Hymenobacter defluvii]